MYRLMWGGGGMGGQVAGERNWKVCSNGPGHVTKMATMPILKALKPTGQWSWNLVYIIVVLAGALTKFRCFLGDLELDV